MAVTRFRVEQIGLWQFWLRKPFPSAPSLVANPSHHPLPTPIHPPRETKKISPRGQSLSQMRLRSSLIERALFGVWASDLKVNFLGLTGQYSGLWRDNRASSAKPLDGSARSSFRTTCSSGHTTWFWHPPDSFHRPFSAPH